MVVNRARPVVLVVDDDKIMRALAHDALEADFEIVEACDGEEALTAFDDFWPDLVLLDVVMPKKDGFEACREIRRRDGGDVVPILMTTGLDNFEAIDRAYEAGATDFITKPINYDVLARRLHYMLRGRRVLDELRRHEQWLLNGQRVARLGYFEWTEGERALDLTTSSAQLIGWPEDDLHIDLKDFLRLVVAEDRSPLADLLWEASHARTTIQTEVRVEVDGATRYMSIRAEPSYDPNRRAWRHLGAMQDVTDWRRTEERIRHLASFDAITGLPNRRSFAKLVGGTLRHAPSAPHALLCARVTNLADIGQSHGPVAIDDVMQRLARRLGEEVEAVTHLGRLGADLFGAFCSGVEDDESASQVARALVERLERRTQVEGGEVWPSIHVGIARSPQDGVEVDVLVQHAITAAGEAPRSGETSHIFFEPALDGKVRERVAVESALRNAIGSSQFHLVFQPKVDVQTGRASGAEALLRWIAPDLGFVGPDKFIPIAEASGLIVPLSEWVFESACTQARSLGRLLKEDVSVAVNASAKHFVHPRFIASVERALDVSGLAPELMQIELTESALMSDVAFCAKRLAQLRDLGVTIALDDFGTGYSSLAYLHQFPLDTLKIDRSFVSRIFSSKDGGPIVQTIVNLARTLDLQVVAEGVEAQNEVEFLERLGCDQIQGYFYSKPLPPAELAAWMDSQRRRVALTA